MLAKNKSVAIEIEKCKNPASGLGNFSLNLADHLYRNQPNNIDFHFLALAYSHLPQTIPQSSFSQLKKTMRLCHKLSPKADLWHLTQQGSHYLPPKKNTPILLTIHDLNYLYINNDPKRVARVQKRIMKKVNRAQYITTISPASKQDIMEHLNPRVPVEVIYNGFDVTKPSDRQPDFVGKQPFLFSIAEITEKKNFHTMVCLLKALKDHVYIIAGSNHDSYAEHILTEAKKHGVEQRVIMPGKISEAKKAWCLKHCEAFLFPSRAEGFGLPVIEAMYFHKPLFISDIPAHRDVAGNFAYYIKDYSPDALIAYYLEKIQQHPNDDAHSTAIDLWLKRYQWQENVKRHIEIYQDLLS